MARLSTVSLSFADQERMRSLRKMQRLATALLVVLAIIFAFAFLFQDRYLWLRYVRAASEGGMVGALADWFAVTALFRHPLGIPIPHTAIIPKRKNAIGDNLGEFVRENFLSEDVIRQKLAGASVSAKLGQWLASGKNASLVASEMSRAGTSVLRLLGDERISSLLEQLARTHLTKAVWAPPLGRVAQKVVSNQQHKPLVDAVLRAAQEWLHANPEAFNRVISTRLPAWLPGFLSGAVDGFAYKEALAFLEGVVRDDAHPLRKTLDRYLLDVTVRLQEDGAMIDRIERVKTDLIQGERIRDAARETWVSVKAFLIEAADNPQSELRLGAEKILIDLGVRVSGDPIVAKKMDDWFADALVHIVTGYRDEIAGIISETVSRWDAHETSQKIELHIGRDLQYIRINGTIVGSLAGLVIFTIASHFFVLK